MSTLDAETLSLAWATDLAPRYGPDLVEHVQVALRGGARSGQGRRMDATGSIADLATIAGLLVSMIGVAIGYVQFRQAAAPPTPSGAPVTVNVAIAVNVNVTASAPPPLPPLVADFPALEAELDDAIADLGREQQVVALTLKEDLCAWLRTRSES